MPDLTLTRVPAPLLGQPERLGLAVLGSVIVAHVGSSSSADLFEAGWNARVNEQRRNAPGRRPRWRTGWDHANTYLAGLIAAQQPTQWAESA